MFILVDENNLVGDFMLVIGDEMFSGNYEFVFGRKVLVLYV